MMPDRYQAHVEGELRRGLSSLTKPADTIRFSFRARSCSSSCCRVLPSFNTTLIRESGCTMIPCFIRPLISRRLACLGPFVTQDSAEGRCTQTRTHTRDVTRWEDTHKQSFSSGLSP